MIIQEITATTLEGEVPALAEILLGCVAGGASVGFIHPFTRDDAAAFWRGPVARGLAQGGRDLLVARREAGGAAIGTVQLNRDLPANQRHRADVIKLLVHPQARRLGVARRLMAAVESLARRHQRTLLVLDTRAGDPSETLYRTLGYTVTGVVPGYARGPGHEALEDCVFFHKHLCTCP